MQPIKQFIIYSSGAIVLRLITASSVLVTIKFINPAQFGILALLNNLIIFLPIILNLGLRQVLAIEFFKHSNHWRLVWQLFLIYLVFAIPACLLLILKLDFINQTLFSNQIPNYLLTLAIATSLLNFLPELLFQLLRFQSQAIKLACIQIIMGLLLASLTVYGLKFAQLGLASSLWAQLITQSLATVYMLCLLCQHRFDFSLPNWKEIKNYLKIGLPFIPNIMLAWLILASNRWLLSWHSAHNFTNVGIYSLAENLSLIFQSLVTQPLMHSYLPYIFAKFNAQPTKITLIDRQNTRLTYYIMMGLIIMIPLGFLIFKPVLIYLLPIKYLNALPLISPLLIAQIILAGTYITSASLQYLKKTHYLAVLMALGV